MSKRRACVEDYCCLLLPAVVARLFSFLRLFPSFVSTLQTTCHGLLDKDGIDDGVAYLVHMPFPTVEHPCIHITRRRRLSTQTRIGWSMTTFVAVEPKETGRLGQEEHGQST
ncbi:MAG: hypothetical protein BYD32DRAFT_431268 [Podila humilis]|nr:MAG: hypothetical protein BYD32DRAFT_431268 [Podila humilis]